MRVLEQCFLTRREALKVRYIFRLVSSAALDSYSGLYFFVATARIFLQEQWAGAFFSPGRVEHGVSASRRLWLSEQKVLRRSRDCDAAVMGWRRARQHGLCMKYMHLSGV